MERSESSLGNSTKEFHCINVELVAIYIHEAEFPDGLMCRIAASGDEKRVMISHLDRELPKRA